MNIRRRILTALALCAVIIGLAALSARHTSPTQAQGEETRVRSGPHIRASLYGLHTLTRGQTARLTVVNTVLGAPPEPIRPRRVTLGFDIYEGSPPDPEQPAADGSVHTLRFLRRVSRTVMSGPGDEAVALEFEASRAGETIAAWVLSGPGDEATTPSETNLPDSRRQAVVTSLEVRQGNRTQFVLPAVRQGFDPQPEPPVHR